MVLNFDSALQTLISQAPLAGAGLWVAKWYMSKHQEVVQKLIDTFENNNKLCEERSKQMFDELMKVKDQIK
jgi:polyhydroxyalkanoate synthesis regulator phasin